VAVGYPTIGTVAEVAGTGNRHGILSSEFYVGLEELPEESKIPLVCGTIIQPATLAGTEVHDVNSVSALIETPWGHVPSPPWDQQARHGCDIRRVRLEVPRHLFQSEKNQSSSVVGGRGQDALRA